MPNYNPTKEYLARAHGNCEICGKQSKRRLIHPDYYVCPKCLTAEPKKEQKSPTIEPETMFESKPDHVWGNINEPEYYWLIYGPNCILVKRVVQWTAPRLRRGES